MASVRRTTVSLLCLLVVGSGVSACGDDESSSSSSTPTSSPTPAVCQDLDAVGASVEKIKQAKLGEDALPVLSDELKSIETELKQLRADADAEYWTEVDAVQSAASSLESSIAAAADSPTAKSLAAVGDDVRAVGSSFSALGDALATTC
jgi:hypothetical protein